MRSHITRRLFLGAGATAAMADVDRRAGDVARGNAGQEQRHRGQRREVFAR